MLPLPPEDLPAPPPALVRIVTDEAYLAFQPTGQRDAHGNRLWDLELWRQGQRLRHWTSVTGSPQAERADRFNRPGNQAVSQDGTGGCIGLASRSLTEDVTAWVRASGARWLWVRG
jgi:hypothetical protein